MSLLTDQCNERECWVALPDDGMYSMCRGCDLKFCDEHLMYCSTHLDQHCNLCCVMNVADERGSAW